MSAQNSGRQSPPPEEQSDKQQQAPTADANGVNKSTNNQQESKDQLAVCLFLTFYRLFPYL